MLACKSYALHINFGTLLTVRDRGLKLSEQRLVLILAYVAMALGLIIILVPIYFCLWRCTKRHKQKEEDLHELHNIYDQNYRYQAGR
jgi:hypothetical protein